MRWFLSSLVVLCGCAQTLSDTDRQAVLDELECRLDDFHQAAADADGARYFAAFAPSGVFIGTDASERWSVEEFQAYARPHFEAGRGWSYEPLERHFTLAPGGQVAWFDERLHNAHYGEARGSGVWLLEEDSWRLAQYNLSFPIPNALADTVVALIRQADTDRDVQP